MNLEIPKVELHLHLDGSVRIDTLSELSGKSIEDTQVEAYAPRTCSSLVEYLKRFSLPISVMQSKENLTRITRELCEDLKRENVIYAEVRFAPLEHTSTLTSDEVVEAVIEGLSSNVNLILCMMRHYDVEDNTEVIRLAKKYLGKGVVGIDLAGSEAEYPTSNFEEFFKLIKELDIPFTIHAGEADGVSSIRSAIDFGARRIGHGVRAIESPSLMNEIKNKKILLEVCPTSNIQTGIVKTVVKHPINALYSTGINLCINTDNRTVSVTNLNNEYKELSRAFNYKIDDYCNMNKMAINGAFISREEKDKYIKIIDDYQKQFMK